MCVYLPTAAKGSFSPDPAVGPMLNHLDQTTTFTLCHGIRVQKSVKQTCLKVQGSNIVNINVRTFSKRSERVLNHVTIQKHTGRIGSLDTGVTVKACLK